jgi:hypothetical protein
MLSDTFIALAHHILYILYTLIYVKQEMNVHTAKLGLIGSEYITIARE